MNEQLSFRPVSASEFPRFTGHPTFMCLLAIGVDEERIHQVDIGIVGVPRDGGTTNRLGGRHGPRRLCDLGIKPMTVGGENLNSLPILRALSEKSPLSVIHLDAHTDLFDEYFGGCKITHGTPFCRAIEEGLLNPTRVIQIGNRGTTCDGADVELGAGAGCPYHHDGRGSGHVD
ncbi:arginase family protein [uncultured Ruegeria sp.]|uniref:arginase family protein n=1 Tax=uncultured Ruegeria sp. TaxID=259304 RepID=UPI00342937EE